MKSFSRRTTKVHLLSAVLGVSVSLLSCNGGEPARQETAGHYEVELVAENVDPSIIPDPMQADFDGDGKLDVAVVTDSSVQIKLTSGDEFNYSVRETGEESPRIWDAKVVSLRSDGRFPSIVLATCPEPSHEGVPLTQDLLYNDGGSLIHKQLGGYPSTSMGSAVWAYPMRAMGLDCAWLESNDLPVCFFASMEDGGLGVSRLIELDPAGYVNLASDSATRAEYSHKLEGRLEVVRRIGREWTTGEAMVGSARQVVQEWMDIDPAELDRILSSEVSQPLSSASDTLFAAVDWLEQAGPRRRARAYMWMDEEELDSALAGAVIREPAEAVDYLLAVALERLDQGRLFSHDLTRDFRLPWPMQYGHGRPNVDGMFMMGAAFVDFSGDGLLDLVVAGQHSRPFSAIQHPDGYFTTGGFHASPDEYVRVWAPDPAEEGDLAVPPCVYFGMEKTEEEAWRSDYVDCYDSGLGEWYDLTLPGGPYWTEYEPVVFWDMNEDGMIDFAAQTEPGTWNVLTFVRR